MADNFDNYGMKVQATASVKMPTASEIDKQIRNLEKSISKLQISGKLDDSSLKNLSHQLDTLRATVSTANFSPTALTELTNQVNRALQNINIGNINVGGVGNQAQQVGQQIGNQINQGVSQSLNGNVGVLDTFRRSLENIGMGSEEIDIVAERINRLGVQIEALNQSTSHSVGRRGNRDILSVDISGIDQLGQAVKLTQQYDIASGELIRSVDAVSTATQKVNTQLENLSAQQIKRQQDLRNQISQIYNSAIDPNASRSITDANNLGQLRVQYDAIQTAINEMGSTSKTVFAEQEANVTSLITTLKNSVSEYKNAENVSTSLKPDKLAEGISKAQSRWKALNADIQNSGVSSEKLTQEINTIASALSRVDDGGILSKAEVERVHTALTNAKNELTALVKIDTSNSSLEAIRLQADTLKNKLDEFAKKNTGFADWTREVNNTTVSVETLKTELDNVKTASDLRVATARVNEFESAFKAVNATASKTNVDKLNADVQTLTNNLNTFASKNAGFNTFKTDINGVEVSLDSLIQKLSTVDNNTDLSTIRSQADALKTAFSQIQDVNKIQHSTDISDLETKYKKFGMVSEEVENNLKELKSAQEAVFKSQGTDGLGTALENYKTKLAETKASVKELTTTQVSMSQRVSQMTEMQDWMRKNKAATELCGDKIDELIQKCRTCDAVEFNNIKSEFKELKVAAGEAGQLGNTFFGGLFEQGKKFIQWTGISGSIMEVWGAIKRLISTSKELDSVMTDFTMATGSTENQLKSLTKTYNKLADELSSTTTDVMTSATEWIKQGQSIADTETLITNAMILSKIGKLDSANATKYLTSAMKGYKVSVEDTLGVVDKLSAVDMASATDVGGLAEGMSEVAASADLAGVSMDKLLGYLAAIGETTQSGMSEVGTTLNAVFSRMGNIKLARLKDYDNNGEDLSNVETVLRGVGITLRDSANSFRDFDEVLDETASNWSNYSEVQQRAIASAFAGTHHMNEFIVLMENYDKALQYTETSLNSSGEAMEKFSAYEKSVEAHTQSFTNAVQGLADTAVDSGLINFFIDLGTTGIKALDGLMEAITPLGTIGLIGGGILSANGIG